jgi:hypothetical protein
MWGFFMQQTRVLRYICLSLFIMKLLKNILIGFAIVTIISCNATRVVKPLAKGEKHMGVGLGGALIKFVGVPMPLPLTNVYGAYGVTDKTTAFGSLHTTALMFGVFQTDVGIIQNVIKQNKFIPGVSISPIVNMMLDRWDQNFSFYPQLDANAYWNYGKKQNLLYASMNNWFELRNTKAHNETQSTHWLPSIGIGHQWYGKKLNWQVEAKYIAPNQSNKNIVVDYIGMGNTGTFGLYIGLSRKF